MGLLENLLGLFKNKIVEFTDSRMEQAIRDITERTEVSEYGDPINNSLPVRASDVKRIKSLDLRNRNIRNIGGIEHMGSLEYLVLAENDISDLTALTALKNLIQLDLSHTQVNDLTPIASLKYLGKLDIRHTDVESIAPIQHMTLSELLIEGAPVADLGKMDYLDGINIGDEPLVFEDPRLESAIREALYIDEDRPLTFNDFKEDEVGELDIMDANRVSSLKGMEKLTFLASFSLCDNHITDVSPLGTLTDLRLLDLDDNPITDISSLKGLTQLEELSLSGCDIKDISILKYMPKLTSLNLRANYVTDLSPLRELKNLTRLDIGRLDLTDISILEELTGIEELWILDNRLTDISVLANLKELKELDIEDNCITDLSPVKHVRQIDGANNQLSDCTGKTASRGGTVTIGKQQFRLEKGQKVLMDSKGARVVQKSELEDDDEE